MTNDAGKSDSLEVPRKSPNNAGQLVADAMEGRGLAKGNLSESNTHRTQSRDGVPSALERIRQAARKDRKQRFTSILHHVYDFLVGKRYVLIDRDPLYTEAFRRILGQGGVNAVRLPARSPNLNAFAERFVLSIKSECLERIVPLGETHLRRAILEYTKHYHEERNHQGLGNELIVPAEAANGVGKVSRRKRLGGLLSFYYREVA